MLLLVKMYKSFLFYINVKEIDFEASVEVSNPVVTFHNNVNIKFYEDFLQGLSFNDR